MKNKLKIIVGVAAMAVALSQTVHAIPITGNIGFSGAVNLNTSSVQTATVATSWLNSEVNGTSGAFVGIANNTPVSIATPWSLNSAALNNFWTVGGFTFNLISSTIFSQNALFLNVVLMGTVSGNGFDTTAFNGTFQVANPAANGISLFTSRMSFDALSAVPDGGTTVIMLGLALLGLALMNRKVIPMGMPA